MTFPSSKLKTLGSAGTLLVLAVLLPYVFKMNDAGKSAGGPAEEEGKPSSGSKPVTLDGKSTRRTSGKASIATPDAKYLAADLHKELEGIARKGNNSPVDYEKLSAMFESIEAGEAMAAIDGVRAKGGGAARTLDIISGPAMTRILSGGTSPEALRAWIDGMEGDWARSRLLATAGAIYLEDGKAGFHELVAAFPQQKDKDELIGAYYSRLAAYQPEKAIRGFLEQKGDYAKLTGILASVPDEANFPGLAGVLFPDHRPGADRVRSALMQRWSAVDPLAAANYSMSSADSSPDQVAVVIGTWCNSDPRKAVDWVCALPSGPKADAAIKEVIRQRASSEPKLAWGMAALIQDPEKKREAYRTTHEKWRRYQPEEADSAWSKVQTH